MYRDNQFSQFKVFFYSDCIHADTHLNCLIGLFVKTLNHNMSQLKSIDLVGITIAFFCMMRYFFD